MAIQFDENGTPYDDGIDVGTTAETKPAESATYTEEDKKSLDKVAGWYKKYFNRENVAESELRSHMRGTAAAIEESDFQKRYAPEWKAPSTTPSPGNGYNLAQLKSAWLGAAGKYAPTRAGLAQFIADNSGKGGFAEGVTVGGSKKNKLYLGNESGGTFLGDVIRATDSDNPTYDWDTNTGSGGGNQSPVTPAGTATTPAETPAQRSARLATFGLGPEGLQSQRPGAPPPRPGQMGDMMGRRIRRGSGPYDPSGGRGTIPPKPSGGSGSYDDSPSGRGYETPPGTMYRRRQEQNQPYDPSGGRGFVGPNQGQGQSEGPIDDTRQVRRPPEDPSGGRGFVGPDQGGNSPLYDPFGGGRSPEWGGQQQGGGYRPVEDPGMYTPGEAYQAPEYRAPDPYQQATPFSRDEYQAATPFAAPTAADMGQDPGYQFRLSQGQKALERSGAARGVTNTGGNMKGLLDYGQQAASQEYGNVYGRNLTTYNTNEANRAGAYQTNYGNALTAYNTNEANRAGAYNTNANNAYQQYTTNALAKNAYNQETESRRSGAFATNSNLYQQRQQDAYNRSQQAYNDAMAEYQSGINNQRNYERDRMSDLFRVAGI